MVNPELCVMCKGGKSLCGKSPCPLMRKVEDKLPKVVHQGKELFGTSPPAVFVGRYGYPKVMAGPMLPVGEPDDPYELVDTKRWTGMNMSDIVAIRSGLFRPSSTVDVHQPASINRVTEAAAELALSTRPLDTEVLLSHAPRAAKASLDIFNAPMGPRATAIKAKVVDNPVVPRRVDAIVSDTDLGAAGGVNNLYDNDIAEEHIQRLFSTGQMGVGKRRRMVPTRWSITAVQDILGKEAIAEIKTFQTVDKPTAYQAELLGNRFHVILLPRVWSFEMVEVWLKGAFWGNTPRPITDHEQYWGRKTYADKVTGAYYAARLSVLDQLKKMRRQAFTIIYREITSDYWAPLGVWVIREGVRMAMESTPREYETMHDAIGSTKEHVHVKDWDASSVLIKEAASQRTLKDY